MTGLIHTLFKVVLIHPFQCFMNSIIQCLRHTKKLRDLFFRDDVMESAKGSSAPTKGLLARGKVAHARIVF